MLTLVGALVIVYLFSADVKRSLYHVGWNNCALVSLLVTILGQGWYWATLQCVIKE